MSSPAPLIDLEVWTNLAGLAPENGRAAFLSELTQMFRDLAPQMLAEIRKAEESADPAAMRQAVHKLKGCAANLGGANLAAICEDVEQAVASGQAVLDATALGLIECRCGETLAELERLCRAA